MCFKLSFTKHTHINNNNNNNNNKTTNKFHFTSFLYWQSAGKT